MSEHDITERVALLESTVERLEVISSELRGATDELAKGIRDGRRTNWAAITAAMAVALTILGGLYGIAISPLNKGMDTLNRSLSVIVDKIDRLEQSNTRALVLYEGMRSQVDDIYLHGAPVIDKRLTILETKESEKEKKK